MIVVPYVPGMLAPETKAWAEEHGAHLRNLGFRPDAYYEALCEWWPHDGELLIVEQDIVPPSGVLDHILGCEFDWCVCEFEIAGGIRYGQGLGCTRFSRRVRRKHPDFAREAGSAPYDDGEPDGAWWVLDTRLAYCMTKAGYLPHGHGEARHLHDRPLG